mgnify:CR=1 FL=1
MKQLGLAIVGVITAASLTVPVMAADDKPDAGKHHPKVDKAEVFKKADANADGQLSLDEFKTMAAKGDPEKKFKAADADKDGALTLEEFKAAHGKKHDKKGEAEKPAKEAGK